MVSTPASRTAIDLDTAADQAAPLDALLIDAALGPVRRFAPNASTARFVVHLARQPGTTARRAGALARELGRVVVGTSTQAPSRRDRRFTDPAWTQNPLLRRLVQGYLATGETAQQLVADVHRSIQTRSAKTSAIQTDCGAEALRSGSDVRID